MRRRGGGAKRLYRIIDFKRDKKGIPAKVATVEYDPNRSALIALLTTRMAETLHYRAVGVKVGQTVCRDPKRTSSRQRAPVEAILLHDDSQRRASAGQRRADVRAAAGGSLVAKEGDLGPTAVAAR